MKLPPLDQHQSRSIDAIRAAYQQGARRIVLVLPCGAGKTVTASALFERSLAKGRRMLWIAHREELVDQAVASLLRVTTDVGIIKAGRASNPNAPIQVASQQTLHARPESLPPADVIVSDECHHDKAATREAIFGRYAKIELLLGLTATPERGDKKPLGEKSGGMYQHLIVGATVAELQQTMRNGHPILVPFRVVGPKAPQKELFREPLAGYLEFGRRADGSPRPAIMFVASLEDSRKLADDANRAGIRAAHVDGETDDDVRKRAFDELRSGRLDLLSNVLIATEGTDVPNVEVIGVARGCSAASTWIQMVMRASRACPATGKKDALLIDYRGFSYVHGLVEEDRQYSLDGKQAISRAEKVELRQCSKCGSVFAPAPVCPQCGNVVPAVRRRQSVKRSDATEITKDNITPIGEKFAAFQRLCAAAIANGWKPAAVGMRFKSMFGYWPPWRLPRAGSDGRAAA